MTKTLHEIRDPIHTFIRIDTDERNVVDSAPVQRLGNIHQLALTYLVYPGATHRRFEHSLGVMELASRVFDVVTDLRNMPGNIKEQFADIEVRGNREYWRRVVRLAALCHDIGHLPFSHAAELELLPEGWDHERLTVQLILSEEMKPLWERMTPPVRPLDVAKLAVGKKKLRDETFSLWELILSEIIVGDAFGVDRMDYLLRDSLHAGVGYGRFDHYRLVDTLRILCPPESDEPQLGIQEGGLHSAEAMLLARYFMFIQVYYHPVRRAYDMHLKDFLRQWLPDGIFKTTLDEHLRLTDNEVLQAITDAAGQPGSKGNDPARCILRRQHYRVLWKNNPADLDINPGAGLAIYNAAREEFGEDLVRRDQRHPSGPVVDFPIELYDGRSVSALAESQVLSNIPTAAIDYVFVQSEKAPVARKWLDEKRVGVLEQSLEKEQP